MADNNGKQSINLSTQSTGFIFAIMLAVGTFWFSQQNDTSVDVIGLKPQIEQLQKTVDSHSEWISTWPTQGELSGDVRQNAQIESLQGDVADLEQEIMDLEDEVNALEARIRGIENNPFGGN